VELDPWICCVEAGGQGRYRTADLPLFRPTRSLLMSSTMAKLADEQSSDVRL